MRKVLYILNEDRALGGSSLSLEVLLRSVKDEVEPLLLIREEGAVSRWFREQGYNVLVVPFYRGTFRATGLVRVLRFIPHAIARCWVQSRCVRKVSRLAVPVDLVHSNSSTVDIGPRIARALGVPHVWHLREYPDVGLGLHFFPGRKAWDRKIAASDAVVAITPGLFRHLGLEQHPGAHCLPDAVLEAAALRCELPKEPYILFLAGTISPLKRPDEAIRIFANSGLSAEDYHLRLVGDIDDRLRLLLEKLALAEGLSVEFLPFTHDVREQLIHAAALLVCTAYEGMGRVAVEAMFYGCPVVARGSGGSADVLGGGRFGSLYSTVEEGAALLGKTVREFPSAQVQAAGQEAVRGYSEDGYGEKILAIYASLWK